MIKLNMIRCALAVCTAVTFFIENKAHADPFEDAFTAFGTIQANVENVCPSLKPKWDQFIEKIDVAFKPAFDGGLIDQQDVARYMLNGYVSATQSLMPASNCDKLGTVMDEQNKHMDEAIAKM